MADEREAREEEESGEVLANVITGVHFVANYSEIPARPVLSSVN